MSIDLPFGSHRLQLGWAGSGKLPPRNARIPIMVNGRKKGELRVRFSLQGMEATGQLPVGPGSVRLRLRTRMRLSPEDVSVSCGSSSVHEWQRGDDALVSASTLLVPADASIALRVDYYGLDRLPISAFVVEDYTPATPVVKVEDAVPDDALLVEAEAWSDAGGGTVTVTPGSHYDEHGGACVYNFHGDGTWLQWRLEVPAEGTYDLFARISCGSDRAFRQITVDGKSPEGLELVEFPGTGGWGHAAGEWWLVRLTGAGAAAPSLKLAAGPHTVRFTGVLDAHLNVDYLFLAPAR